MSQGLVSSPSRVYGRQRYEDMLDLYRGVQKLFPHITAELRQKDLRTAYFPEDMKNSLLWMVVVKYLVSIQCWEVIVTL